MKKLTVLLLVLSSLLRLAAQECKVSFENFESYCNGCDITADSTGNWIKFNDDSPVAEVYFGSNEAILNIPSKYTQNDDIVEPELIHVLDIEAPDIIEYSFDFYNECGRISLDFLASYTDAADYETFTNIDLYYFELLVGNAQTSIPIGYFYCDQGPTDFGRVQIKLDFNQQTIELYCDHLGTTTLKFDLPADRFYGIAFGSNQCNYITNICVNEVANASSDSDVDDISEDYPWFADFHTTNGCQDYIVEIFEFGGYSFLFIQNEGETGNLYFSDGTTYCQDALGFDCRMAYGLVDPDKRYSISCDDTENDPDPNPSDQYPWMTDYIDFDNCESLTIQFYDFFGATFPYFEVDGQYTLFSNSGQVYCTDAPPGFICPELYGLDSPIDSWSCQTGCLCPAVVDPVCGADGNTYTNACEADCRGVQIISQGACDTGFEIFDEFPWESIDTSLVCTTVYAYQQGSYYYLYLVTPDRRILYNFDGQFYCESTDNYDCIELYGFTSADIVSIFDCNSIQQEEINIRSQKTKTPTLSEITKIFPNPARDFINISTTVDTEYAVSLYDINGQQIIRELNVDRIAIAELSAGTYILQLVDFEGQESMTERIVIVD